MSNTEQNSHCYQGSRSLNSCLLVHFSILEKKTTTAHSDISFPFLSYNPIEREFIYSNRFHSISIFCSFSPTGRLEPPRWACGLCALGLFFYQSLDAIDGKQARRTNSSSPLGELFDHGCDSISTIFVALSACISAQIGFYPKWMFFQVIHSL